MPTLPENIDQNFQDKKGIEIPYVIQGSSNNPQMNRKWILENTEFILKKLSIYGAVLLRDFNIKENDFEFYSQALSKELLTYTYRSTPRSSIGRYSYTSTNHPASETIPQHCENSYQRDWPTKLFFFCKTASDQGGRTPLASIYNVTRRIDKTLREKFDRLGVKYVRNYGPHIGLSWQETFNTNSKEAVEEFCKYNEIKYEWNGDRLKTIQVAQGVIKHKRYEEKLWFNQAHLFHYSSLNPKLLEAMLSFFKIEDLPRNAYYGDGSEISMDDLNHIRAAFDAELCFFDWQSGDLLVVDNLLVSHGRTTYTGKREILVSMADLYSKDNS